MNDSLRKKLIAALVGTAVAAGTYPRWQPLLVPAAAGPEIAGTIDPALSAAVPSKKLRAELRNFFRSLSAVVESGEITTTGRFRTAYRLAVTIMKKNGRQPDLPGIDPLIQAHIRRGLGLKENDPIADVPLTDTARRGLAAELMNVAASFQ